MLVNEAVIDSLVAHDIDTVFGIPGKQSLPLNETIGNRDDIRFVVVRHETAVSHQAWGYAETSGRMAATVVIPGPGDLNATNGLKNALNDCTPLVHISIETDPELRGGDDIHETPPDTYDNLVKTNLPVKNPQSTLATLEEAIETARTPPMGPVRVGIPRRFLSMDVPLAKRATSLCTPGEPPADAVERAATIFSNAEYPVIIAGGGVRSASATSALEAIAERLTAPVVTTYKGKGVIPDGHELSAGVLGGSSPPELFELIEASNAALAVGTDLDVQATRKWTVDIPDQLVHVTLGADDIGTGYEPSVGIVADARLVLEALDERLASRGVDRSNEANRAVTVREAFEHRVSGLLESDRPMNSVQALRTIRKAIPDSTIVSVDAGGFRVWAVNAFEAAGPRRYVNPGSWATMGSGVPAAIGAQLSNPDEGTVAITGDGGLMMCVHELHTAVAEGIPVVVVVLNNEDYAIISEEAGRNFDLADGEYGWPDAPIDYVALASSMGMDSERVERPTELEDVLEWALDSDAPWLIEVPTDPAEPQATEYMAE